MSRRRRRSYGRAQAKFLLGQALRQHFGESTPIKIGWIDFLGKGICRRGFIADVEVPGDPDRSRAYVVLRPLDDAEPECDLRTEQEAKVLQGLARAELPLRIPELIATLEDDGRPAIVETAVAGFPLDLRAGRQGGVVPWEVVAEVATAVHGVDTALFQDLIGHPSRRDHAEAELAVFEDLDEPLVQEARAWAFEHRPPRTPSVLLHGDLLGQNILLALGDEPPGLIDWERATLGDPAYDLAIVTRGLRRPFQTTDGLALLLEAYAKSGGQEVTIEQVYLHELCLVTHWYRESMKERSGHPPDFYLNQLRGIFRRATTVGDP